MTTDASSVVPRVLVVEDDAGLSALLEASLTRRGYAVSLAGNRDAALKHLRADHPDLVLLDLGLPDGSGLDVLDAVRTRADGAEPLVIVLSGAADRPTIVRALDRGAHDYVVKPFDLVELAARVAAAMRLKRRTDDLRASQSELALAASIDVLTGCANRRTGEAELVRRIAEAERDGATALSVLFLDVDQLKSINDDLGHAAGDAALCHVVDRTRDVLRAADLIARWGGDEFLVLLPDTDRPGATAIADRVKHAIAARRVELGPDSLVLSVSVGAVTRGAEDAADLIAAADDSMRAAKRSREYGVRAGPRR